MGLGPAAVNLYLELWQRGTFKNVKSAIDMGSQELHMKSAQFEEFVKKAGIDFYKKENFPNIDNWPAQPRTSSKYFFKLLGIENYKSLDLNGELDSVSHDLNYPFEDKNQWGQYDLVTDHGTNEHAFNASEAYRTMHRLCKENGYLIIAQNLFNGNGYYNFDISFFEGIAAANNYKILYSAFEIFDRESGKQFHIPLSRELLQMFDFSKLPEVGICYVFQKQNKDDFKLPYQEEYLSKTQNNIGYQIQFLPSPPSRTYVPMFSLDSFSIKSLIKVILKRILKKLKR